MHLPEAGGVPEFGREVTAFFDLFFLETNVLTTGRDPHQAEPQPVGAVFIDQLEHVG